MKKILFILITLTAAPLLHAHHTVERSVFTDNWRFGLQTGGSLPFAHAALCRQAAAIVGLRAERYLTPAYGLGLHLQAIPGHHSPSSAVGSLNQSTQLSLEHLVNLNNFICGYNGRPDIFELTLSAGLGWGHSWKHLIPAYTARDYFTSRLGLQIAVNPGRPRAWYVYLEPAITWRLTGQPDYSAPRFHRSYSAVSLSAGVSYRIKNRNGTHYFKPARLYDQVEVDALNAKINDLRRMLHIARKKGIQGQPTANE
ncbi:MAG: hypothetical protein NC388_08390 [Clostridium sp.]|nr:hypothetical protein [Clostridium sp.]